MAEKIEFTQEQISEMINLHNQGYLNREIAEIFDTSRQTIGRRLRENDVPSRHPWLDDSRKKLICEHYLSGMNFNEVAKAVHCSDQTVRQILEEQGIEIRDYRHDLMTYAINEEYFNEIDTENKAYILGLLYADGNVSKNATRFQIYLQEQDVDILHKILQELESTHPLIFNEINKKNPNWQNQYGISISNRPLHDALISHGVLPNKSLILKFPINLSEDLYPHFIRGYLDGDGSISKNPKEKRLAMVGTLDFCTSVKEIIEKTLGVHCSISLCHGDSSTPTRTLGIAGGKQVKKFLDWIYKDAELYLERKFKIYQDLYCS